jgi:hypothetical protein
MGYLDKPLHPSRGNNHVTMGDQFFMAAGDQFRMAFDNRFLDATTDGIPNAVQR